MRRSTPSSRGTGAFKWTPQTRHIRIGLGLMLSVSLACNVAALIVPFFSLRRGLGAQPYTLLTSVEMLWESRLYFLAVLVVAFSVCFPFAKLAVLGIGVGSFRERPWFRKALSFVKEGGKWSLLDAYLVCLVLCLTSGQLLVGTRPMPGTALFVVAVVLSMTAGEWLARTLGTTAPESWPERGWTGHWRAGLLFVSGGILFCALLVPFLQIDDWLLANRRYSILTLVGSLLSNGFITSGLLAATFLVITPLLSWAGSVWLGWGLRGANSDRSARTWMARVGLLRRWSMLDVFSAALGIFILEGDYLMSTEVRSGAAFLVLLVLFQRGTQWAAEHTSASR